MVIGMLLISVTTGTAREFGRFMGCEIAYTSAELAASFLSGGLVVILYRNRLSGRRKP
jgi:hypothetical protein